MSICTKPCENGICEQTNKCQCNSGFKLNESNKFKCDPICSKNCISAECIHPDICKCFNGN